ncbi:MAG: BamA/TamA family outer membrane protein, partial [Gammaproteobacteria bacterium]|nr:BamA/TamA family outer membrane protein [Gammaproteobacteria bacterium]
TMQVTAAVITQIEFVGNKKTHEYVLLQEMQSQKGSELNIKTVEADVQAIMDLNLFRDVKYFLYTDEDDVSKKNIKLVIHVKEKYYLFVLPELRIDEEDKTIHYGVRAYWDNILGTNQSLRLKVREHGETLGVNDIRQSLTYRIPRINGSPYTLDLFTNYRDAAVEFDAADPQLREEIKYGFNVQRWRHLKSRSSGWYLGAGLYTEERSNEALYTGDSSRPDYQGDFLELRFGYKRINQYLFNRRGKDFGYILDTTRILFNAEENYTKHLLFYRSYYRFKPYPLNNLNVQLQLGVSDGDYLGDTVFSLGGKTLRGYEKDSYTGNAMVLMNLEYLIPFSTDPAYRYGVLFDLGNTYDSAKDIDLADLHAAIGVGFRWKLAAFVKVNIRMDIGYAIDTGSSNILLNSRHLF